MELLQLNNLKIPRHVLCNDRMVVELHGFSDTRETAYGGSLYIRTINKRSEIVVKLLFAKR